MRAKAEAVAKHPEAKEHQDCQTSLEAGRLIRHDAPSELPEGANHAN